MPLEFEYFDFIPRKEFRDSANRLLNEIGTDIPSGYRCEARCTFFANKFFFQIAFRNGENRIASQTILDPSREITTARDWQIKAILHMASQLKKQFQEIPAEDLRASG